MPATQCSVEAEAIAFTLIDEIETALEAENPSDCRAHLLAIRQHMQSLIASLKPKSPRRK
jgi:hypothetical protein